MIGTSEGNTHRLGYDAIHTCWDQALPPRVQIAQGDTVIFQTREPSQGGLARQLLSEWPELVPPGLLPAITASASIEPASGPGTERRGHALTGPVAIADARPGDTLVIEILELTPGAWGWTHFGPDGGGLLRDELKEPVLHLWDLRGGATTEFAPGITIPIAPFCGVMGVAPAEVGQHPTAPPFAGGGNMDIRQLITGSTLQLPVLVPGGLFSVGDAHAAQGDGEVTGTAIEMDATVALRFTLLKGQTIPGPRFFLPATPAPSGPWFAATGQHSDLYEAAREALRGVLAYLHEQHGIGFDQACVLASVRVDLRISQIVNAGIYTVSALLPLSIFTS